MGKSYGSSFKRPLAELTLLLAESKTRGSWATFWASIIDWSLNDIYFGSESNDMDSCSDALFRLSLFSSSYLSGDSLHQTDPNLGVTVPSSTALSIGELLNDIGIGWA